MRSTVTAVAFGLAACLAASTVYAQQGDGDTVASAAAPAPQDSGDGFVDEAKEWAKATQILERMSGEVDGWYPRLGGMTRGSGFSLGPGYRHHFGDVLVDASAGLSIRTYKAVDLKVRWLQAWHDRVELWTNYRYEDFPQEDYFGPGPGSSLDARTSYDFDSNEVTVRGLVRPRPWLQFGTTVGYMSPDIGRGSDEAFPSIEQLFSDAEAPGLLAQPNFLHTTFAAEIDYRDAPGRPRDGGFYQVEFGIWDDRTLQQFDFRRFDVSLQQFVPLDANKAHVVAGRFGSSFVNNETGERVPFYFLPYVGGVDTVRSFHEFRFKDENAAWMTVEYIFAPFKYVSLSAFADAGTVRVNWQDTFDDLKTGYGFGIRGHSEKQTFVRLDVAAGGGEGWQVFFKLMPSF